MTAAVLSASTLALRLAVVGAGPVGLTLALQAARLLPHAQVTLFDARRADHDVAADPRTLALSLGSVQLLRRLGCWDDASAAAIDEVQVSQQPPAPGATALRLSAAAVGVPQLGAVLSYGALVAPLQRAWQVAVQAEPQRLVSRFDTPVAACKALPQGVELDAGVAEAFDLAVIAEGGVFANQTQKSLVHAYGQTAWVGTVALSGAPVGTAFERFTRHGPVALLPLLSLPPAQGSGETRQRAALVWCVSAADDPVRGLDDAQRLAVLNATLPAAAGRVVGIGPLQPFALGLNAERTLVQGRTVRIGNAAQTLHPVAGQGLNLGLRDAVELTSLLRWAGDVDSALRRADWARGPDRWSTIATTDFLARSFTWQLPGAATARGLGLKALDVLPGAKGWLARRMMFGSR